MNQKSIKYSSTNRRSPETGFREALLKGLAPDGGLYMPTMIPELKREVIESFTGKAYHEIAFNVLNAFLDNEIEPELLADLCREAYNFDVPFEIISDRKYVLRLDRGPSASFKDFAARMMARLMHHYVVQDNLQLTVLTATSGDTGSAVASAFHGLRGINLIILFPEKEVSDIQRRQMTTLGDNIRVIAIDGKFDDCQKMVKQAFRDPSLSGLSLTSANSINIGRLLPQSVYYFYVWAQLSGRYDDPAIFSVPSGNYGNLMGGIIAARMGLPVSKFIIAANLNNEVTEYLRTGTYVPVTPSINCISNAMNVGHPSNFARIIDIYNGVSDESGKIVKKPDIEKMRKDFSGFSITDEETKRTIAECYKKYGLLLEPHGAVAWSGLDRFISSHRNGEHDEQLYISLETAHPGKFSDAIRDILGFDPELPDSLVKVNREKEDFETLENNYELFCKLVLTNTY